MADPVQLVPTARPLPGPDLSGSPDARSHRPVSTPVARPLIPAACLDLSFPQIRVSGGWTGHREGGRGRPKAAPGLRADRTGVGRRPTPVTQNALPIPTT